MTLEQLAEEILDKALERAKYKETFRKNRKILSFKESRKGGEALHYLFIENREDKARLNELYHYLDS